MVPILPPLGSLLLSTLQFPTSHIVLQCRVLMLLLFLVFQVAATLARLHLPDWYAPNGPLEARTSQSDPRRHWPQRRGSQPLPPPTVGGEVARNRYPYCHGHSLQCSQTHTIHPSEVISLYACLFVYNVLRNPICVFSSCALASVPASQSSLLAPWSNNHF